MRIVTIAACLVGCLLFAAQARAADPKLVQLGYEHSRDGSSKHFNLSAYAHRADQVRFVVRRHHEPFAAPGRYNDHVTDTDLHPEDASHPWEVNRREGGKRVLKAIRDSLGRKGRAVVRVIARNGEGRDKARVVIATADCAKDPPLYPLSCEVGLWKSNRRRTAAAKVAPSWRVSQRRERVSRSGCSRPQGAATSRPSRGSSSRTGVN